MKNLYLPAFLWLTITAATAQISLVKEFGSVGPLEPLNNLVVFNANGQLWRSDGTSAGTILLSTSARFSNSPSKRCRVGNTIYFFYDNTNELWKTDGTASGTVLVKALGSGFQGPLVGVNSLLLFGFDTATTGSEIWRSDGTDAGTYMVTDLNPGTGNGYVYPSPQSAVLDGYFYFQGPEQWNGTCNGDCRPDGSNYNYSPALYRTDGTAAGTTRVANGGFEPNAMNVVNGKLIYAAYTGTSWTCSGTTYTAYNKVLMKVEGGTASVLKYPADIIPRSGCPLAPLGNTFINTANFVNSSNYLYFRGQTESVGGQFAYNIWRTDGTTEGTIQLTSFANGGNEVIANTVWDAFNTSNFNFTNLAYFPIRTSAAGIELWRSDGTPGGTYLLKDIYAGSGDASPSEPRTVNGTTYFTANDGSNGIELWKTDGTQGGTQLVQNLNPGVASQPTGNNATSAGQTYYFYGNNGSQLGLFATNADGSALPVRLLYFSGAVLNQQAVLSWATTLETSNKGFSILKSRDALAWESIGFVAGRGESSQQQNYTFTDASVLPGQVWYYKLRQSDQNGQTKDSKVISLRIEAGAGRSLPYPNPSPDGSFRLTTRAAGGQTVRLFTLTGLEIAVQSQANTDEELLITPRQALANGVYVIKLTSSIGATKAFTLVVER